MVTDPIVGQIVFSHAAPDPRRMGELLAGQTALARRRADVIAELRARIADLEARIDEMEHARSAP